MTAASPPIEGHAVRPPLPWWALALAIVAWVGLWTLTPGLLANGVGSWFTDDDAAVVLIESAVAAIVLASLLVLHRRMARALFARQWTMWAYAIPAIAAVILTFHYELPLPLPVYMVWMLGSVVWQNAVTFGLLQSYLEERIPRWGVVPIVAVVFAIGHMIWLPDRFGLEQPLGAVMMLVLGLVLASIRAATRTLHLNIALHLAFYYILA